MNSQLEIKLATKMTDTPETDAMEYFDAMCDPDRVVEADFARKLERERDVAQKAMGDARDTLLDAMPYANASTKILAEMIVTERDKYEESADALVDRLGATQERMINAEREREEWKAKYIQQNKDLGCEMMDPNGTIWDYAKKVQRELTVVTKQRDQLEGRLRGELGGHPDSELWGDAGLIAATMRAARVASTLEDVIQKFRDEEEYLLLDKSSRALGGAIAYGAMADELSKLVSLPNAKVCHRGRDEKR